MDDFKELISYGILMKPDSYSKVRLAIENLSTEEWFRKLYRDPQYNSVIWKHKSIRKMLLDSQKVEMMKKDENKAKEFIRLVKDENR
jgi:hypothetical protein